MSEWRDTTLGDICKINMGQSPKSEHYNYEKQGLPFLQGNRTFGAKYPTFDTYTNVVTKIAEPYDVIMSVRAPVGDVNITPIKMCLGRGVCSLNHNQNEQEFLYYLIRHYSKELINNQNGTVFGCVNYKDIANLKIMYPPLPEQKAIAEVLSSLDDKIDLLSRQNKTLEALASTYFRQWFIEEASDESKTVRLDELAVVTTGKGLKKDKFVENGKYPILGANGEIGRTNEFLYNEPLIITGRVGTHGKVFLIDEKVWISDNVLIIKSKKPIYRYAIYFFLKNLDYNSLNVGSTQPLITQTDLKNQEINYYDGLFEKFDKTISNLFDKIYINNIQIQTLKKLRDTLLPKLISGEVHVTV